LVLIADKANYLSTTDIPASHIPGSLRAARKGRARLSLQALGMQKLEKSLEAVE
jgi:hypothetical protein